MTIVPSPRLVRLVGFLAAANLLLLVLPGAWVILVVLATVLAGAAALDLLITPSPRVLSVTRLAPERFSLLNPQTIGVLLQNQASMPLQVRIRDGVPERFRPSAEELTVVVPAEGEARGEYAVTPTARGKFPWAPLHLAIQSLLGLWERRAVHSWTADARVYPNVAALQRYHLLAKANHLQAIGIRKVRVRGGEWEFESLRDYAFGDDIRRIDWKASARRSRLTVRVMQAERNQSVLLLIDCGRLMNAEIDGVAKLDHAVNAALLLSHVALARGDRVGLCAFSAKVQSWLPPRGHLAQNRQIAEALYDLRGDLTESDHGRCLWHLRLQHPKRALLIVLTDFVDTETAADMVAHLGLAARRHLVLFVAFNDPFLERNARGQCQSALDGFRKAAALELLHERREVLERIRQLGAHVIDANPADVAPPMINRYLELTLRGKL